MNLPSGPIVIYNNRPACAQWIRVGCKNKVSQRLFMMYDLWELYIEMRKNAVLRVKFQFSKIYQLGLLKGFSKKLFNHSWDLLFGSYSRRQRDEDLY